MGSDCGRSVVAWRSSNNVHWRLFWPRRISARLVGVLDGHANRRAGAVFWFRTADWALGRRAMDGHHGPEFDGRLLHRGLAAVLGRALDTAGATAPQTRSSGYLEGPG